MRVLKLYNILAMLVEAECTKLLIWLIVFAFSLIGFIGSVNCPITFDPLIFNLAPSWG